MSVARLCFLVRSVVCFSFLSVRESKRVLEGSEGEVPFFLLEWLQEVTPGYEFVVLTGDTELNNLVIIESLRLAVVKFEFED